MTPDQFDSWRIKAMKSEEEQHLDALTEMIIEGKKEEEALADSLKKILNWVNEEDIKWVYEVWEVTVSDTSVPAVQQRQKFLDSRGGEGWILCSEVVFNDDIHGKCSRYTFRKKGKKYA